MKMLGWSLALMLRRNLCEKVSDRLRLKGRWVENKRFVASWACCGVIDLHSTFTKLQNYLLLSEIF
jgi:hypothetical protein